MRVLEPLAPEEFVDRRDDVLFIGPPGTDKSDAGDPLTARTVQVPAGRAKDGTPPFTWELSAADALAYQRLGERSDWSLAGTLQH